MARFTQSGTGDGSGIPGPQGPQGNPGADGADGTNGADGDDFGIYYLGNYNSESGYVTDIAVVKGSDGQLYLAKASGQLGDPINYQTNGQWEIWIPKGADGSDGADGNDGTDALWNFTGEWVNGVDYAPGDVVQFGGSSYYAPTGIFSSYSPPNNGWLLVASKGTDGADGAQGDPGTAGGFGASASYYSTADQGPQASVDTVQAFTYNNTDWQTGVLLQNSSQIKMLSAGKYNIAFSAQLYQTNNTANVNIWLSKNGSPVTNTNTKVNLNSNNHYLVAAWNFFVDAAADDYYELIWSSSSTYTSIQYDAAVTINDNVHPAIPSIILTVNQVG